MPTGSPTKTPTPPVVPSRPPGRPTSRIKAAPKTIQLGVIGVDSSHLAEFSRRINTLNIEGRTPCRVTRMWTDGKHDLPEAEVEGWQRDAAGQGVATDEHLDHMLDRVDGVMVLTVNGRRHLAHAGPALRRGLPTYIDKPLTCDLAEAHAIRVMCQEYGTRCYSASSLRFADEVRQLDRAALGEPAVIDAFGPGEIVPSMPRFFHYAVHTIEMVDAIWGPGVEAVRARISDPRDHIEMRYRDGRYASLRLERIAAYDFGATVHGKDGVASFKVDFSEVYNRLVQGMVRFFEGGPAPTDLDAIVENVAVMEAAQQSVEQGSDWVTLS